MPDFQLLWFKGNGKDFLESHVSMKTFSDILSDYGLYHIDLQLMVI